MLRKALFLSGLIGIGLAALSITASAQVDFHVLFDTSHLDPTGTYGVGFDLSDGSVGNGGASNGNQAIVSAFTLGSGSLGAVVPPTIGNASYNSGTGTVTLADGGGEPVSDLALAFAPGSTLGFNVHLTGTSFGASNTDVFQIYLLDKPASDGVSITTNAPSGQNVDNAFAVVDLISLTQPITSVQKYSNASYPVPAPTISAVSTTPEPGALSLLAGGALGSVSLLRRRRRAGR